MSARYELRDVGVFDRERAELVTTMSGARWDEYHAWLAEGNAPDLPPPPPEISIEEALARKLAEIEDIAAQQRKKVTGPVSPQEMASWTIKRDQALAYDAAAGDKSAPMLAVEARARGVATAEIVKRVLANADGYARAEAAIAGVSGRHKDAVRAMQTSAQLLAYDATDGWPFSPPRPPAPLMPAAPTN